MKGVILSVSGEITYQDLLSSKYEGLQKRSFSTKLDLFLFDQIIHQQSLTPSLDQFIAYELTDILVQQYEKSWQIQEGKINGIDVNRIDALMLQWSIDNKELNEELKMAYKEHFFKLLPITTFAITYPEESSMRKCHYCGISEEEIGLLRSEGLINTKNARGRHHEIDRINSNKEYTEDNIVLACYWCNNAKTDEFTYDEFQSGIGPAIKQVWVERIEQL